MDEQSLPSSEVPKDNDHVAIKGLLEKNLKWSQIILGILFFPTLLRKFEERYGAWFGITSMEEKPSPQSVEEMIRVLPITDVQKDQLRSMLK
jgi:hypothetical protein